MCDLIYRRERGFWLGKKKDNDLPFASTTVIVETIFFFLIMANRITGLGGYWVKELLVRVLIFVEIL